MNTQTPKVSIVILNWNGADDTIACISSLKKMTYSNYDIIVVDNGSSDNSIHLIQQSHPDVILIKEKNNLGFAGGCNRGIELALNQKSDFICLLNNDTVVSESFLSELVSEISTDPSTGILGAKIMLFTDRSRLDHIGGTWDASRAEFILIGNREPQLSFAWDKEKELDYVCGASMLIKREVFEKIGLLEEKFFLIWEEADFCFRARKEGFKIRCCPTAELWHKVSASFKGKAHSTYFWWRNRLLWIERNCTKMERDTIYKHLLNKEIRHIKKIYFIKSIEFFVITKLLRKQVPQNKAEKLHKYMASLQGIKDFKRGQFGQGPHWIYKNPFINS